MPHDSNHPSEHKISAIKYLVNRLTKSPLSDTHKYTEYSTIKHILHNNKYNYTIIDHLTTPPPTNTNHTHNQNCQPHAKQQQTKLPPFTYTGRHTNDFTKLFRNTNINVAYKTQNTICKILAQHNTNSNIDKFSTCGMYQLTCIDCNMKYVGQRGRPLRVRYREHFRDFKFGNGNSKFAQNLIEHKHSIGPIDKITHTFHFVNKGSMLDTLEKDHIYRITNLGSQINDRNTVVHNILFDTIPIEGIPNS